VEPTSVRCDFVFWDWTEAPDPKALEDSVNLLLSKGASRIYLARADTGGDDYCIVVSDSHLSDHDAKRAYDDWDAMMSPDGPPPDYAPPFVWHRPGAK